MSDKYFLNEDHTYTPCDLMTWATQFENMDNHVDSDHIDGYHVSTVWLGLDHNWGEGEPLLFETMVFAPSGSMNDIYLDRYSTWDDAVAGHQKALEWVSTGCGKLLLAPPEDKND